MGWYIAADVDGSPHALAAAHRAEQLLQDTVGHVRAARPAPTGDAPVTALLAAATDTDTLVPGSLGLGRTAGPGLSVGPACDDLFARARDYARRRVGGVAPAVSAAEALAAERAAGAVLRLWCVRYPEAAVSRTVTDGPVAPAVIHHARHPHA
ncbi:hypothetical protein [Streptomyces sp. NPDC127190]|uniref:hypothetical protein n=1 Tax=unclassified Streptomyces TaxID=2593676 RepID=UPI0036312EA4